MPAPTRYQQIAEALVVVGPSNLVTVPGSGVRGPSLSEADARRGLGQVRSVVQATIDGMFHSDAATATASERIADVTSDGGLWWITIAEFRLAQRADAEAYCEGVRAELADLLQILVEGEAGEDAVIARKFGPPESPEQEIHRLRGRIAELERLLTEARARLGER